MAFPKKFHHEGANYETGGHPHLSTSAEVLNREQALAIHKAALQILEKTGLKMEHPSALDMLPDAGSKVSNGANGNYFYGTGSDATFTLDLWHPNLMKYSKKSIKLFKSANRELRHGNEFAILQAAYT